MKKKFLEAGKILNVHGIQGELKFEHWCDSPDALKKVKEFFTDENGENSVKLISKRVHGRFMLLKLEGVDTPEAARLLKNTVLYVRREDIVKDPGSVFISDLIGLDLIEQSTGNVIGKVKDVVNRGASDLYVIDTGGREEYFPAVSEFVLKTDLEKGIFVKVPLGLFDKEN